VETISRIDVCHVQTSVGGYLTGALVVSDLIYDVGLHYGDDTAYYLHKGYRVVAVDADPMMVEGCNRRFADEIRCGKLMILNLGIASTRGNLRFWVHKRTST
jgi:hypothetical protein